MTDHTAKNLVSRDLINLRNALKRCRPIIADLVSRSAAHSELLMRIDTLIFRHADPELDVAKMWAAGDYRSYPVIDMPCDGNHAGPRCSDLECWHQ